MATSMVFVIRFLKLHSAQHTVTNRLPIQFHIGMAENLPEHVRLQKALMVISFGLFQ